MNKEHFIQKAKETTQEELAAGWVYLGPAPSEYGLSPFNGQEVIVRGDILLFNKSHLNLFKGWSDYFYFMRIADWQAKFGPLPQKSEKEILQEQIQKLEKELEDKKKELSKINYVLEPSALNMRGQFYNGKICSFGFMKLIDEENLYGYYLGNPNRNNVKWEIEEKADGVQILKPDFS